MEHVKNNLQNILTEGTKHRVASYKEWCDIHQSQSMSDAFFTRMYFTICAAPSVNVYESERPLTVRAAAPPSSPLSPFSQLMVESDRNLFLPKYSEEYLIKYSAETE